VVEKSTGNVGVGDDTEGVEVSSTNVGLEGGGGGAGTIVASTLDGGGVFPLHL